jgi:hypothetical protein
VRQRIEVADLSLGSLDLLEADSIAAFVGDERPLVGLAALVDWRLAGAVSRAILAGTVTPEHGEALLLPGSGRIPATRVFLFGIDDPSPRLAARAVRHACEALRRAGSRSVGLSLPASQPLPAMARAWLEAAEGAGFARQVLLGDLRTLAAALEGAAKELGTTVEVVRMATRVEPATG